MSRVGNLGWVMAANVCRPESLRAAESLGVVACQILDRWALGWPRQTRRLEVRGRLIDRLREQSLLEAQTLADARIAGLYQSLADHEILKMHEIDPAP